MANKSKNRIKGKIKSYSPTKGTGSIIAKRKVFEFYTSDMVYELEANDLRKDVNVEFLPDEGTNKHYAKAIEICDSASSVRFEVPEKFLYTRELGFDDWLTIEIAKETMSCRSSESYADAMNKLVEKAKTYKANALIDLIKSTKNKQEPYVCRAQPAVVAKPSPKGAHTRGDLMGLNHALRQNTQSGGTGWVLWAILGGLVVIAGIVGVILALR